MTALKKIYTLSLTNLKFCFNVTAILHFYLTIKEGTGFRLDISCLKPVSFIHFICKNILIHMYLQCVY